VAGRALIAGAGIGGLTAALALARAGFEAAIFERTAVLEEFGAGLQLTPNATRILGAVYSGFLFNPSSVTTTGTGGSVSGDQYQAITLQYFGDGLFSAISNEGLLVVQ